MKHLDYALCCELKEAGFNQYGHFFHWVKRKNEQELVTAASERAANLKTWLSACPTLEELIEALPCLPPTINEYATGGWRARSLEHEGTGDTPTEAVAKLWLALNKGE